MLILSATTYTYFKFHNPGSSIRDMKPEYRLSATRLFNEYQLVEMTANTRYTNKVIEVYGQVKEVKTNLDGTVIVVIDAGNPLFAITCRLAKSEIPFSDQIKRDEKISLRGTCKGILIDVLLENCTIE